MLKSQVRNILGDIAEQGFVTIYQKAGNMNTKIEFIKQAYKQYEIEFDNALLSIEYLRNKETENTVFDSSDFMIQVAPNKAYYLKSDVNPYEKSIDEKIKYLFNQRFYICVKEDFSDVIGLRFRDKVDETVVTQLSGLNDCGLIEVTDISDLEIKKIKTMCGN